ncbi:hypothetical protein EMMF5_005654 [Cystobasidiomycetes sp. EMM_F5]
MSSESPACTVSRLDHVVLTVLSVEDTAAWYVKHLGMKHHVDGQGRHSVHFGDGHKINLHELGREFEPKATHPTRGSGDLCFVTDDHIEAVKQKLEQAGVDILVNEDDKQIVKRTSAAGTLTSIYFRDPDGNLVE